MSNPNIGYMRQWPSRPELLESICLMNVMTARGWTTREQADWLNNNGYKNPKNNTFDTDFVYSTHVSVFRKFPWDNPTVKEKLAWAEGIEGIDDRNPSKSMALKSMAKVNGLKLKDSKVVPVIAADLRGMPVLKNNPNAADFAHLTIQQGMVGIAQQLAARLEGYQPSEILDCMLQMEKIVTPAFVKCFRLRGEN